MSIPVSRLRRYFRDGNWRSRAGPLPGAVAGAAVLALSLWQPRVADAQESSAAAETLFNDARAAMAKKQLDVACEKFRESDRLDPAVGTHFNLANCEEQRGHLASAWGLYRH